jgi:putative membrane protein
MSFQPPGPPLAPPPAGRASAAAPLTDGEWHRMHKATPLLRGGIALVVLLGIVVNNARDWLLGLFIPGQRDHDEGDPVNYVVAHNDVGWVLLGIIVFVIVLIGLFTLSWRFHEFRITGEVVEVRSGVLFRNNRKARLDRIQGINVVRPFLARIFGAARIEISQAGNDANVKLEYLSSNAAEDLRARILSLASGAREEGRQGSSAGYVQDRVNDFLQPEFDPASVRATRVVRVHHGRLVGSLLLSGTTVFLVLLAAAIVVSIVTTHRYFLLVSLFPAVIGAAGFYVRRFTKSLQYTIAATRDGIRIGYGFVGTTNETLPPGRIHAVQVTQPLLWRPFGWWEVRINRASHAGGGRDNRDVSSIVLPVGDATDVRGVLEILLPELVGAAVVGAGASFEQLQRGSAEAVSVVDESLTTSGDVGGFVRSPGRGAWLRPLSWRRNGYRFVPGAVLIRLGLVWRRLVLVPLPRVQSVRVAQGPVHRLLRLAEVHVHTVHGPVVARVNALAADDAMAMWSGTEERAIEAAGSDTSHRWRAGERAVPPEWSDVPTVGGDR